MITPEAYRPEVFGWYLHEDGGVYTVVDIATCTESGNELVIYQHFWPFERKSYARPIEQWNTKRFRVFKPEEFINLDHEGRAAGKVRIAAARTARKLREAQRS